MKYSLIIFDMDGTLVQSEDCASQALIDVIPALVGETPASMTARYKGVQLTTILADIEKHHPGSVPADAVERYRQRENELSASMVTPSEGAASMLTQLTVEKCIASNAPARKTKRSLDICGLSQFFHSGVFSAYEVNAWKPDPDLFLHVANTYALQPQHCLVVEDSEVGLQAAKAAAMNSVLYDPHNLVEHSGYTHRIRVLEDLLNLMHC